jgi:purine-binding chemotaxis protein CheW
MTETLLNTDGTKQFVALTLAGQLFGIPVMNVHDVLQDPQVNTIPLAPPEVAGSLNLRGKIVTAIDLRCRLGINQRENGERNTMCIVIDYRGDMYSLVVDSVRDVLTLADKDFEKLPSTVSPQWRDVSQGIYKLENELLLVLDIAKLFAELEERAA